ncbi:MAG: hypothetical protein U0L24_05075 [Lachnospiraceae bacterium]|nr:hypothetical protein [Lachnospiraceae bacterium]
MGYGGLENTWYRSVQLTKIQIFYNVKLWQKMRYPVIMGTFPDY